MRRLAAASVAAGILMGCILAAYPELKVEQIEPSHDLAEAYPP